MKLKVVLMSFVIASVSLMGVSQVYAVSEVDVLLNKLVEKNILTVSEAEEVRNDIAKDVKASSKSHAAQTGKVLKRDKDLPKWVRNTKWFGDIRLRYEAQLNGTTKNRHRERVRARFGFKTKVNDEIKVGVRLATGSSGDPVSTNQTFSGAFDSKDIRLDQAWVKYSPSWLKWASLTAGKMKQPFKRKDIVWDSDITPEGAVIKVDAKQLGIPDVIKSLTFGGFRILESSSIDNDAGMLGVQVATGVTLPVVENKLKTYVAYYDYIDVQDQAPASLLAGLGAGGNRLNAGGTFESDFNIIDVISEVQLPSIPVQDFKIPVKLWGEFVHNTGADDDENAWQAGLLFGKKPKKKWDWQAHYTYKWLESDATFGPFADSDFNGGGTNSKGHLFGVKMGLNKNWTLGFRYIRAQSLESGSRRGTFQLDTVTKF